MQKTLCLLVVAAALTGTSASRAQDNSATVEALFGEGKKLAAEGKYSEACPKFLASYTLEHRMGTLLNLADCYEKNSQLASAWARFVEAHTLAERANQTERAEFAAKQAALLAPRLSKLTITITKPEAGLEVKRDGVVVDPAAFGASLAVDGGKHVIEASAPLKKTWSKQIDLAEAKSDAITVPTLDDDPEAIRRAREQQATHPAEHFWTGQRIVGVASAVVGLAGIGVGAGFGVQAKSQWADAKGPSHCDATGCDPAGVALGKDAATSGTIATIGFIAGGAFLVTGAILFLTGGHKTSGPTKEVSVIPIAGSTNGVLLRGSF